MPSSSLIRALTTGWAFSAWAAAFTKNGIGESLTPSRAAKESFACARSFISRVMSTSTTEDSCACSCRAFTMLSPMTLRMRVILTVWPRSGEASRAGALALGRRRSGGSGRSRSGRGGLRGLGGGEDVLLADTTADAGALDGAQVDAVLGGELAHQRGDVRAVVGGRRGGGSRSRSRPGRARPARAPGERPEPRPGPERARPEPAGPGARRARPGPPERAPGQRRRAPEPGRPEPEQPPERHPGRR